VVLTGAGVSAESGIPTFRGPGGLWKTFRPEDLATPQAFARDPRLVWEWYDWRRQLVANAAPNPAHLALASHPALTLITQNVDGLHDRAGSRNVLKLHGDLWTLRCLECESEFVDRTTPLPQLPPSCPQCAGLLRPGVVWFGESLPEEIWSRAQDAAAMADVFLVIGTSAQVHPAAGLAMRAKRGAGARIIEVNLEPSGVEVDAFLEGRAGELLPALLGPE
jgi:NAD-dependent deacetylase